VLPPKGVLGGRIWAGTRDELSEQAGQGGENIDSHVFEKKGKGRKKEGLGGVCRAKKIQGEAQCENKRR